MERGRAGKRPSLRTWRSFLRDLDMFYLGTANAEGQPYIQYRGGPPGFLKVIDDHTLGFADFGGNRQYITLGNLSENPKAFIFLMDYANSRRVKLWGTAKVVEKTPDLLDRLRDPTYPGKVERAILFTVEAWDVQLPTAHSSTVLAAANRSGDRATSGTCGATRRGIGGVPQARHGCHRLDQASEVAHGK